MPRRKAGVYRFAPVTARCNAVSDVSAPFTARRIRRLKEIFPFDCNLCGDPVLPPTDSVKQVTPHRTPTRIPVIIVIVATPVVIAVV